MSLLLLKSVHISSVAGSYVLFFLRGIWSLNGSPIMSQRWIRIVPHFVDTLLITSAISLAISIHQYPLVNTWLTAKFIALLVYIGLGFVALRDSMNKAIRFFVWLAAQAVFAYIVLVAINHNPFPW